MVQKINTVSKVNIVPKIIVLRQSEKNRSVTQDALRAGLSQATALFRGILVGVFFTGILEIPQLYAIRNNFLKI